MVPINYLAVLLCGVLSIGLGSLWFGPIFGKAWMDTTGMTQADMDAVKNDPALKRKMYRSYAITFVFSLVMAFVLAHSIIFAAGYLQEGPLSIALQVSIWSWLGFMVPISLTSVLWDKKSWKYFAITSGYYLLQLVVFALILAFWR